ncbi:flagellin [Sinorhizobium sp. BG8]|uniref:flagellin N-terminal helical domain-containing protein n=1 Tax=Sinorhizobium sp. BG8 TaxID=2613773 RepID=UPI00193E4E12|nr:flagellin [Sinorhizobium sp. BG8]QRM54241.1 flagellar protein FlaD [Sinorhizobium sp. BG8]
MTSILTNGAAMAALQTLRAIDSDLETTQARVSSGYKVETAADNAAYWSIATTMRSDNRALSTVQDALGLGAAKVDTAYAAMESAIEVVTEIKAKLVAAYGVGADREKIQDEIAQLQDQLASISESASFSGENWLQDSISDGGSPAVENPLVKQVVASFIRTSSGQVAVKTVDYSLNSSTVLFDLSGGKLGILDSEMAFVSDTETTVSVTTDDGAGTVTTAKYAATTYSDADLAALGTTNNSADSNLWDDGTNLFYRVDTDTWVAVTDTDPATAPATTTPAYSSGGTDYYFSVSSTGALSNRNLGVSVSTLDITNLSGLATAMEAMTGETYEDEDVLDVLTQYLDTQLLAMTSAASGLGSIQSRIEMQESFIATLTDTIDEGIGRLVDADMNEESTRLQALQTQQQLGIQSLSIANTNSQNILQLFQN